MKSRLLTLAAVAALGLAASLAQAQKIDGTWKAQSGGGQQERVTFRTTADAVTMSASTGTGYTAKLDGSQVPLKGEKEPRTVSVKLPEPGVLEETTYKDGKPMLTFRLAVAADGKTAQVTWKSLATGKTGTYAMVKD